MADLTYSYSNQFIRWCPVPNITIRCTPCTSTPTFIAIDPASRTTWHLVTNNLHHYPCKLCPLQLQPWGHSHSSPSTSADVGRLWNCDMGLMSSAPSPTGKDALKATIIFWSNHWAFISTVSLWQTCSLYFTKFVRWWLQEKLPPLPQMTMYTNL